MERVLEFLCEERDFSQERVNKALEKLETAYKESKSQANLDTWFS
jgi:flap endonuclease-1